MSRRSRRACRVRVRVGRELTHHSLEPPRLSPWKESPRSRASAGIRRDAYSNRGRNGKVRVGKGSRVQKTAYLSRFHRRFHIVDLRHSVNVTKLSDRITAKHHVTVTFSANDDGWVLTCSSCGRLEVVRGSWSRASDRRAAHIEHVNQVSKPASPAPARAGFTDVMWIAAQLRIEERELQTGGLN